MNRSQRRNPKRRKVSPEQRRRASRRAEQLFVWRYCENRFWRMTTGWGLRGIAHPDEQAAAHNLALSVPLQWQAISITYLRDQWGKEYRVFGFARTHQAFVGMAQGICPLLDSALSEAEEGVNDSHIYGRAMVFAPWTRAYPSLLPILKLRREQLRLTQADLAALAQEEARWADVPADTRYFTADAGLDEKIAALL